MPGIMETGLILLILKIYVALFILGPIVLRLQFRFKAKLDPQLVPLESLPPDVRAFISGRVSTITSLGFEQVGIISISMTSTTGSYICLLYTSPSPRD